MKILLLNISLLNAGDDAYETVLHIQIPKGLYFIRILELVRTKEFVKQESFEIFLFHPDIFQIMLMDCWVSLDTDNLHALPPPQKPWQNSSF